MENTDSVWHKGEKALHKHLGISKQMEEIGKRMVRPYMPDQHRKFFNQLPFIVAGVVDEQGDVWASFLTGEAGFIQSPDDKQLNISTRISKSDPAYPAFISRGAIGLIGIELHTRRRNRMNGTIHTHDGEGISVKVGHSFGNCPQYIQLRDYKFISDPKIDTTTSVESYEHITPTIRRMIEKADTFFVSSYIDLEKERQVDVSHRGGKPGFIRVDDNGKLTIPDFAGNLIFNTLGNFLQNPKAGLIFPDFETGDVLQMTGDAEVILDSPEIEAFEGAERLWTFQPRRIVLRKNALPLRWTFKEYSPNSLMAGSWEEAQERLTAQAKALEWRDFRVSKIIEESAVIKSFWLEPADGSGVVRHQAGQHLPIQVQLSNTVKPELRTYTLSTAPSDSAYRISVKRDGLVSQYLHNHIKTGDTIKARAPQGEFVINAKEKRPVVMLSAGVGVTPFISMVRHLAYEGKRTRGYRPTWLFQAARTYEERAFDHEFETLMEEAGGQFRLIRLLSETDEPQNARKGLQARISVDLLKSILPFDDYDFYLCGPTSFMKTLYNDLRDMNVADSRIFFESFGPASVTRRPDFSEKTTKRTEPAKAPIEVSFSSSSTKVEWKPDSGSLLELAEASGLSPNHSCRMGSCGDCKVKLLKGEIAYTSPPTFPTQDGEVLICCSVPADTNAGENVSIKL